MYLKYILDMYSTCVPHIYQQDVEETLPEGISRSTFPIMKDGKKVSSTRLMTQQLKAYHAKFGKKIKMHSGGGRRSVWRCTDYIDKERLCKSFNQTFDKTMACQVCVHLSLNNRTKEMKILPGTVWDHTVGVCSTVEKACQSTLDSNKTFASLLRANVNTPIKKLMEQLPVRCGLNEVTRARQKFIKREVSVNICFYICTLYIFKYTPHILIYSTCTRYMHFTPYMYSTCTVILYICSIYTFYSIYVFHMFG